MALLSLLCCYFFHFLSDIYLFPVIYLFFFSVRSIRLTVKITKRFDHSLTHFSRNLLRRNEHPVCIKQRKEPSFSDTFILAIINIVIILLLLLLLLN